MNVKRFHVTILSVICTLLFFIIQVPAYSATINCLKCHAKLTIGKSLHLALNRGCPTCHSGIDASTVPHKKTNNLARGLSSAEPELCFGCHNKELFTKKNVHPAIEMGCNTCHKPHSSENPKLLTTAVPALCLTCHDKTMFTKKNVHPPVASGECMTCHTPHSSDEMALLVKKPIDVCHQCHPDIPHGTHISINQQQTNTQEGQGAGETEPQDPKRPGKPFYCGSCHDPHSSDSPLLFRFNAQSAKDLCVNCHPM